VPEAHEEADTPDPLEELEVIRQSLAEGGLDDALVAGARALSVDPNDPRLLEAVDEAIARHPSPLAFAALGEDVAYGIVALRARALAKAQRWGEAADLAVQLATFRPKLPYLARLSQPEPLFRYAAA
jgi:hypothetical protein